MNEQDAGRKALVWLDRLLRPRRAAVLLQDGSGDRARVLACHGLTPAEVWDPGRVNVALLEQALQAGGGPLVVCDPIPSQEPTAAAPLGSLRSVLVYPVGLGSRKLVLYADDCATRAYTRRDLLQMNRVARELQRLYSDGHDSPKRRAGSESSRPPGLRRPSRRALACYLRSLHVLLASGVMIDRALLLLGSWGEDPVMASTSRAMAEDLRRGQPLSWAMARHPGVFSSAHSGMVQLGEASGTLERMVRLLADVEETRHRNESRLAAALTYPAALLSVCLALLLFGLPRMLAGHFKLLAGLELPLYTRIAMQLSELLTNPWTLVGGAGLLLLAIQGYRLVELTDSSRAKWQSWLRRIPCLGRLLHEATLSRFAWCLACALEAGCSLRQSLSLAADSTGDAELKLHMRAVDQGLVDGRTLEDCFRTSSYFPRALLEALRVGQESGSLAESLRWTARMYELGLEVRVASLAGLAEPVALALMGGVAGFFALATMLPLVRVVDAL